MSSHFWDHCWVSDECLCKLATSSIPQEIEGYTVDEMSEIRVGWKWDLFANLLPALVLKNIAALKLKNNPWLWRLVILERVD